MVASSPMDDFEEADVLPVPVPRCDVSRPEVLPDFASLSLRHTEPDEPVADHEREAPAPRVVEELESASRTRRRISGPDTRLDAINVSTTFTVNDTRGPSTYRPWNVTGPSHDGHRAGS